MAVADAWDLRIERADVAGRLARDTAVFCLALLVPTAIAFLLDTRTLHGASVWAKPMRFALSLGLHFLTLALLLSLVPREVRTGRILRWSMAAAVAATLFEMIYITLQAARGRASHYNNDTPFEAALYGLMGAGAATIVAGSFVLGLIIWLRGRRDVQPTLRLGAALGLVFGSAATLVIGFMLGAGPGVATGPVDPSGGLPVVGWSTIGGDLKVAHFLATHAMQVLPLMGLLADRALPEATRARAMWLAAAVYALACLAAVVIALRGVPITSVIGL